MSPIFRIEMLPAGQGDCLWIEYGDPNHPHRVLVDGGLVGTYPEIRRRMQALPQDQRQFDLLIVTHVDSDHIRGVLKLLTEGEVDVAFDDIWFNGYQHLRETDFEEFGPVEGERLTTRLLAPDLPWNCEFEARAVKIPDAGALPERELAGGMKLTLLSPGSEKLLELHPVWEEACREAGLDPNREPEEVVVPPGFEIMGPVDVEELAGSPFAGDSREANGSSIAVLAEFDGRRALLAGDAHPDLLLDSLQRLVGPEETGRLRLDAFKLSHHGSKANLSREILDRVACARYLFSTNGAQHRHPDREAVARVIKFGGPAVQLLFNYRTTVNAVWDDPNLMQDFGYGVRYPEAAGGGLALDL